MCVCECSIGMGIQRPRDRARTRIGTIVTLRQCSKLSPPNTHGDTPTFRCEPQRRRRRFNLLVFGAQLKRKRVADPIAELRNRAQKRHALRPAKQAGACTFLTRRCHSNHARTRALATANSICLRCVTMPRPCLPTAHNSRTHSPAQRIHFQLDTHTHSGTRRSATCDDMRALTQEIVSNIRHMNVRTYGRMQRIYARPHVCAQSPHTLG